MTGYDREMATEENTDRFYFEKCILPLDESDSEFNYEYVTEDDGSRSVEVDSSEDLQKIVQVIEESAKEDITNPIRNLPSVTCRPEMVEDFVRNFLVVMGMQKTLDVFQDEWYSLLTLGLVRPENCQQVDDVYSLNVCLERELQWSRKEIEHMQQLLVQSRNKYTKVLQERNHHKINHRRLCQEKERLVLELSRVKQHLACYEPMVAEITTKYQLAMKEKMLAQLQLERTKNNLECSKNSKTSQSQLKKVVDHQLTTNIGVFDGSYINNIQDRSTFPVTNDNTIIKNDIITNIAVSMKKGNDKKQMNPKDSKFPKDMRYNHHLTSIKLPAPVLSVYGGFQPSKMFNVHQLSITSIKMHPDKITMATTSDDRSWKLWNVKNQTTLITGQGHLDWVSDCDFSPCGRRIATTSGDTTLKIWDSHSAVCLHTFMDHQKAVWSCSWHHNGDFVATGSLDNTAKIWDLNSLRCRFSLRGHKDSVNCIEFLHYSNTLLTCSADNTVCLWDARMNVCGGVFIGHKNSVNHCKFGMKGTNIISCDSSGIIKIWEIRTKKILSQFNFGPSSANMACFDPTGSLAVVASNDAIIRLIELSNEKITNMMSHQGAVQCIYYDPVGDYFISGASDRDVIIWS